MATKQFSDSQLIKRSLTPSATSGFLCLIIGIALVVTHVILLSVSFGTSLPGLLDGQWSIAYTENVVQPLTAFFTNGALNKLIIASLWGSIGLVVYLGFEYIVHNYKTVKDAQRTVALNADGSWNERPMQQYFVKAMLWRAGILVLAAIFFISIQPLLKMAMEIAPQIVVSQNLTRDAPKAVGAVLSWTLFCHGCVVLLRLYTMRTRLFGDEKLY